ncbi:hypothetical protein SAMN05428970_1148 [Agromyces sp. CF514]|uniref:hypothetical protein n=1 Tax=Agromyces sp. CF514 TaxID=1881031 RepID=UPI0008EC1C66|nr:hypothetical protein [Agromyces sp. CF514]SFR71249.1 hypothetical protein SAMN05428970_1148 [Agromyces sp. CF514]
METTDTLRDLLADAGLSFDRIEQRSFPGEDWLIVLLPADSLTAAQGLAGAFEKVINASVGQDASQVVVVFRPVPTEIPTGSTADPTRGRLAGGDVDQLVQLLEARSRTSDALPSLKYMEDPRAGLSAISASRHQLIFGRRGVGKTALLLEAKADAERRGHATTWVNAHVLRHLTAGAAAASVILMLLESVVRQGGDTQSQIFDRLRLLQGELAVELSAEDGGQEFVEQRLPELNTALRAVLRDGLIRAYLYLDDFYLVPMAVQPVLLDYLAGALRDCDGWMKIASIERLSRVYEQSTNMGLEIPHDATKVDLDVTLEDPGPTQRFLESVLINYVAAAGVGSLGSLAKPEALARLVLASGGVPRDYLNLVASSIVVARQTRERAREIGREDVAVAAGRSARRKKRDLEQDVDESNSAAILQALESLSTAVKQRGYVYFRVNRAERGSRAYELMALLTDLRFVHLVQASLSDQHQSGVRYEAHLLDLSEYTDVRLKRGLHVLDLEDGRWILRQTGQARFKKALTGTLFRDELRQSPAIDLSSLDGFRTALE